MSLAAALLPEYDQETANTRKVLERIPEDKLDWKPHRKSFSFLELANHIATIPEWGTGTLASDSMDVGAEAGEYQPPTPAETVEGILEAFDRHVAEFRRALERTSDEDLMASWTLREGEKTHFTMPRMGVLRAMIMNHMIHHRGQLAVYLRLNDVPVPAIYGPSADEAGG